VSPILVRPVREQLEHDRVIRLLQARWRRRYQVGMNPGAEQNAAAGSGAAALYPDLVLSALARGHRLEGVVEVETGESVHNLEAMAQWAPYARLRVPFYLYVPTNSIDAARRLCAEHNIPVAELWSYYAIGDQMRFTMVHRAPVVARPVRRPAATSARRRGASTASAPRRKSAQRRPAAKAQKLARPKKAPGRKPAAARAQKRK
jgi:hypothetical protein